MAAVTVIARPGKITTDSIAITMHAVPTETHNLTNTVTDHPVEEGFNPADHSRPNPDQVLMDCMISNTPLSSKQRTEVVRSGAFTLQTTAEQAAGAIGAVDGFALGEWAKLKKLREDGTLVKVVTTLGDYDSMAIESISIPRSARNYDAIRFTIGLKRVRVVKNKLTRDVKSSDSRVGGKKSAGNKTSKVAEEKDVDPARKVKDVLVNAGNATLKGFGGAP